MKRLILLLVILGLEILFTAAIVFAQTTPESNQDFFGTFKQGDCINLIQTCSNCTFVNISSVLYPNSSMAIGRVRMTKDGTFYNYTFCNTTAQGEYRVTGYGDIDYPAIFETFTYTFIVTPAGGMENNLTIFVVMIIVALGILLVGYVFKNDVFAVISGFAFMATGVYGMVYGFASITTLYTRIISYIIIGIGAIISLISSLALMDINKEFS